MSACGATSAGRGRRWRGSGSGRALDADCACFDKVLTGTGPPDWDIESVFERALSQAGRPLVDYRIVLADNVREARKARDLSQEALALVAEIDRTYVSGIERGRRNPSLSMIVKLAEHLQTTPADLLTPVER